MSLICQLTSEDIKHHFIIIIDGLWNESSILRVKKKNKIITKERKKKRKKERKKKERKKRRCVFSRSSRDCSRITSTELETEAG